MTSTDPATGTEPEDADLFPDDEKTNEDNIKKYREHSKYMTIGVLQLATPWISIVLYLFDVLSDQLLAVRYGMNGEWTYASLTIVFVLLPSFYVTIFMGRTWKRIVKKRLDWPLLLPLFLFNLEPVVQYVNNFHTVRRYLDARRRKDVQDEKEHFQTFVNGSRFVSDLKYSEALTEALPQFVLQAFIVLRNFERVGIANETSLLQAASLVSSLIGLGVIIFIRHKVFLLDYGTAVTPFGRMLWTSGRFLSLVGRTVTISTSASLFLAYTLVTIGCHWLFAAIWRYATHWKVLGLVEPVFQGAADTLVARVDSSVGNWVSHAVIRVENCVMLLLWYLHCGESFENIKLIYFLVVVSLDFAGAITDILYMEYKGRFTRSI